MKKIEFIYFDLDNTLLDHSHAEGIALKETFESDLKAYLNCGFSEFKSKYHEINTQMWSLYSESKVSKDEVRLGRFRDSLSFFNVVDFDIHQLWENYAKKYRSNWKPIAGAAEILDYLKNKNYRLGIISNGFTELQKDKIRKMNWENYFDSLILSEEIGVQKPNPQIFTSALSAAQISKENIVYIGDSYETDILGAEKSGWKAIFFNPNNLIIEDSSVHSIAELNELKKIF